MGHERPRLELRRGNGVDRNTRIVAVCHVGPHDINACMVRNGWVLAYRRYSMDDVDEEAEAKAAGAGMWRGECVAPREWRQGRWALVTVIAEIR